MAAAVAYLYRLKGLENLLRFSDVFRGYRLATLDYNGLKEVSEKQFIS